jgi:hypothetical protein
MMVDGAVVMVENAFRLMAERQAHGERVNRTSAVLAAAKEVANPIAFAIGIIIVVFLPLFALEGLEGKLPWRRSPAMGSSLIRATLVLASLILKPKSEKDTRFVAWLKRRYRPILEWALARKGRVLGIALVALAGSLALFPFLGKEFMPQLQEGSIMWRVTGIPSTSLDESIQTSKTIADAFKKFPEVETTLAMIGRAEKGETADVNYMEIYTALTPEKQWKSGRTIKQLEVDMQETLEKVVPNVVPGYTQPIQMRVEELISGVRATLALKLYGEDLNELDRISAEIKPILAGIAGVADLSLEANVGKPQIRIVVNRAELARHGMNAEEVLTVVRNGLGGEPVSVLLDGVKRFDIAVRLDDATRASVEDSAPHSAAHRDRCGAATVRSRGGQHCRGLLLRPPRAAAALRGDPDGRARSRRRWVRERGRGRDRRRGQVAAGLLDRMGWRVREPAAGTHEARGDRPGDDLLHLPAALHGLQFRQVRGVDPRQRAVRDAGGHPRAVHHRAVPVGPVGHRFHRRVRCGHAQRHRTGELPERVAGQGTQCPRGRH